jgi:hypothetical protein
LSRQNSSIRWRERAQVSLILTWMCSYSFQGMAQIRDRKDDISGASSLKVNQSQTKPARTPPIDDQNPKGSGRTEAQSSDDNDVIYFSGAATGPELKPDKLPSLGDRYIPLESMNAAARDQAFLLWLGRVYLRQITPPEPDGSRPEDHRRAPLPDR